MQHKYIITLLLPVAVSMAAILTVSAQPTVSTALPPTLPPYLQNPAADAMTICFLARDAQSVSVTWQPTTSDKDKDMAASGMKIPGTPWAIWKVRLTHLQAGAGYTYHVNYRLGNEPKQTPVFNFHTLNPQAATVRFAEVNDIHNHAETLAALMRWVKPDDYEFMVLDGDMWTNPDSKNGADKVFHSLLEYICLCNASEKPMLFVRGNHDTIGNFADRMAYFFDMPLLNPTAKFVDQNWYYTLKAGPVWLLALDSGDDFTKRMEVFQPGRERQKEWLGELMKKHAGADALWRILIVHQPLYNDNWVSSEPCRQLWEPLLKSADIDLEINGHEHCLWKQREKGKTYAIDFKGHYPDQQDLQGRKHYTLTPPFHGIIGGGPFVEKDGAVKLIAADEKSLSIRLLAAKDGRLLTEYTARKNAM